MIDEAIGKILGMAFAYVVSGLGLLVAYINYRKRIVKADRVMTPAAWGVIAVTVLATLGGVVVVGQLAAERPAEAPAPVEVSEPAPAPAEAAVPEAARKPERRQWTWLGILIPAAIFLFATVVTTGLHRHFSTHGH